MTQGERVREIRKALGLTLEKFGEKLGVKKNAISQIENGRNSLTEANIKAICREFNVDYIWLTTGEGEMFSDLPQTALDELCKQYNCDDFDKALIDFYLTLDTSVKQALKQHIRDKFPK